MRINTLAQVPYPNSVSENIQQRPLTPAQAAHKALYGYPPLGAESFGPSDPRHTMHKYHGKSMSRPAVAAANISCGVYQLYGLHGYPPLLSILFGLLFIKERKVNLSQYILSDTDSEDASYRWSSHNLPDSPKFWTTMELELARRYQPGACIETIINGANGILGSCVSSVQTQNRNSNNRIRTFVWTIPYELPPGRPRYDAHTAVFNEPFDFERAVDYVNDLRSGCEW